MPFSFIIDQKRDLRFFLSFQNCKGYLLTQNFHQWHWFSHVSYIMKLISLIISTLFVSSNAKLKRGTMFYLRLLKCVRETVYDFTGVPGFILKPIHPNQFQYKVWFIKWKELINLSLIEWINTLTEWKAESFHNNKYNNYHTISFYIWLIQYTQLQGLDWWCFWTIAI